MKFMYLFLLLCLINIDLVAQPNITRSLFIKSKVCTKQEIGFFHHTSIGNRIYAASLASNVKSTTSSTDAKLVVMNESFDTLKSFVYGGSSEDRTEQINVLPNGHLLLSGYTYSKDYDLSLSSHAYAASEIWMLEVDTLGNIIRNRTFGGSGGSSLTKTIVSSDGYIYMTGNTLATDYDFVHSGFGSMDDEGWTAKLDTAFNIKWVLIHPGNQQDGASSISEVNNNKFLITYNTKSTNLEMGGAQVKGYVDMLVECIDSNSNQMWLKRIGGSGNDVVYDAIVDKNTGILYTGGITSSIDGDIAYHTGNTLVFAPSIYNDNVWVCKIDTLGNILASKAYGSKKNEPTKVTQIILYENKIWLSSGYSYGGDDFDSPEPPLDDTLYNDWIGIVDTNINLICKYSVKSNHVIQLTDFIIHKNNLFSIGYSGYDISTDLNTFSCDTDKTFQFILNLSDAPLSINELKKEASKQLFKIAPNPAINKINVDILVPYKSQRFQLRVFDKNGSIIINKEIRNDTQIDISKWSAGLYYMVLENQNLIQCLQFLKQ